eukprot:tig00020553_g10762.t1
MALERRFPLDLLARSPRGPRPYSKPESGVTPYPDPEAEQDITEDCPTPTPTPSPDPEPQPAQAEGLGEGPEGTAPRVVNHVVPVQRPRRRASPQPPAPPPGSS